MTRQRWAAAVRMMEANVMGNTHPLHLTDEERGVILDYLAKYFGPDVPPFDADRDDVKRELARTWITGEAAKSMVVEYDLPPSAGPHDVAVDAQGNAWVAESKPGYLGKFDPRTLEYTRVAIPGTKENTLQRSVSAAHALEVDPQGRLWMSDHRNPGPRAIMYDPRTEQFTFYPYPEAENAEDSADVNTIRHHRDGTVWFTDLGGDQILKLDPATKRFTKFPVPSGRNYHMKAHPYGMAIDGDGWVWFAVFETDKMGRIDPRTGEVAEYDLPTSRAYPRRMGTDAEGNVWFGEYGGIGKLGMADRQTAKLTEFPTPTKYSGAYSASVDQSRNLVWISELMADRIARFNPKTKTFVEYPLPTLFSSVRRIEADPSRPGRVWYTGNSTNRVGYLEVE
jgi:virginiamycin B lyase